MAHESLEHVVRDAGSPVAALRNSQMGGFPFPAVPDEYSNWMDEQRSWRETCGLWDMSHHMTDLYVEGPDALALFSHLGVNDFTDFGVNQAKQFVACNHEGYLVGDAVLSHLAEDRFNLVGTPVVPNWVQYNAETGDYDVTVERDDNSVVREGPPELFRYQIQGPNALPVVDSVAEEPLPDTAFFDIGEFSIAGHDVRGLRHGMAGEAGYELFGPWEDGEAVWDALIDAGGEYGLRRVGARAFPSSALESGWLPYPVPAIFDDDRMRDYREWLSAHTIEAGPLAGSYDSADVTDYYVGPTEAGYGRLIDLDHEFVGRDALAEEMDDRNREKVTLVWNDDDVTEVFGSLFAEDTCKYVELPKSRYGVYQYDAVLKDGDTVGVSKNCGYTYNDRTMLSLAVVDGAYADPGTEVTLVWGDAEGGATRRTVERHRQTEIRATVAPVPYLEKLTT